jgi:hypothetical protein
MTTSSLANVQCNKSLFGNLFLLYENTLEGALFYVIIKNNYGSLLNFNNVLVEKNVHNVFEYYDVFEH